MVNIMLETLGATNKEIISMIGDGKHIAAINSW
jgi:hypothetical protein